MVHTILNQLNENNGSNYKMDVLRQHSDNDLLKRVLKMTYDKVAYTYGISMKNINSLVDIPSGKLSLTECLDIIETEFVTRNTTGNAAITLLTNMLNSVSIDDRDVLTKIINRDLRINMGKANINKVFKNLIVKPVYMRCGLFNDKTAQKVNPDGAFVQLKADGTYREFVVNNGEVTCHSRSGESYEYPIHFGIMSNYPDGHYIGELTVNPNGQLLDRATGNGLINSDTPPHNDIKVDLWDYVTPDEYSNAARKIKGTTPYSKRFAKLTDIVMAQNECTRFVNIIETYVVKSFDEALKYCSYWMNSGLEGAILKDANAIFRDGTSQQQLKMKLEIDIDVRLVGFKEGTPGTVREKTFGAMYFETDDGMIKGSTSGFSDKQLADFNSRRNELIGNIMTVTCNDITKGRDNDHHALSHPRFVEFRSDKTETDTLDRALETKKMAMNFK